MKKAFLVSLSLAWMTAGSALATQSGGHGGSALQVHPQVSAGDDNTKKVGALFQKYCQDCHDQSDIFDDKWLPLEDKDDHYRVKALKRLTIPKTSKAYKGNHMPQVGSPQPSDQEMTAMEDWLRDNLPKPKPAVVPVKQDSYPSWHPALPSVSDVAARKIMYNACVNCHGSIAHLGLAAPFRIAHANVLPNPFHSSNGALNFLNNDGSIRASGINADPADPVHIKDFSFDISNGKMPDRTQNFKVANDWINRANDVVGKPIKSFMRKVVNTIGGNWEHKDYGYAHRDFRDEFPDDDRRTLLAYFSQLKDENIPNETSILFRNEHPSEGVIFLAKHKAEDACDSYMGGHLPSVAQLTKLNGMLKAQLGPHFTGCIWASDFSERPKDGGDIAYGMYNGEGMPTDRGDDDKCGVVCVR